MASGPPSIDRASLRPIGRLLIVLLAVDGVFLVVHALHVRYGVPGSGRWLISLDRGNPELFQYLKEGAVVALLLAAYRHVRSAVQLAWAAAFVYLLLDDSLEIHETIGDWLALGDAFGIEGRDLGQVAVSATVAVAILAAVAITTVRDRTPARWLTAGLTPVLLALGFFGVVADVIEPIDVLGLVEDGGEMVSISAAVAVAAWHYRSSVVTRPTILVTG